MISQQSLIDRVNRGELKLDLFLERLHNPGYIIEGGDEQGCSFSRTTIDQARQEDLRVLFETTYPSQEFDIYLDHASTCEGGQQGAFTDILFNSKVVSREEALAVLVKHNQLHNSK